jgi:hypothetical protein
LVWGSGFWTSILNTGTHPWTLGHWQLVWNESTAEAPAVAVLLAGAGAGGYAVSRSGWGALREAPYLVYFLVSWAVLAATLGKVGSSSNYFYEPLLTSLLLAVWAADRYQPVAAVRAAAPLLAALAILTLLAPAGVYSFLPRPLWHERAFENQIAAAPSEATRAAYATEVAALVPTPARILNLATPQLQFARDGLGDPLQSELILNDPFLYSAIFGSTLPAAALDRPIREQAFDLLILPREWQPGMRFPDSTLAAIADAYIPAGTGVFHYFLPRQ